MYPRDVRVENPQEALVMEQALAMYRELRSVAAHAADGEVLSRAESLAVVRGREFTRKSLEAVLQEEINDSEKKGEVSPLARVVEDVNIGANKRVRYSRPLAR